MARQRGFPSRWCGRGGGKLLLAGGEGSVVLPLSSGEWIGFAWIPLPLEREGWPPADCVGRLLLLAGGEGRVPTLRRRDVTDSGNFSLGGVVLFENHDQNSPRSSK